MKAHDEIAEMEQTSLTSSAVPARRKPGPKPGRKPGPKPKAALEPGGNRHANGTAAPSPALIGPVVATLVRELAAIDAAGARVRAALKSLRA